MAILGVGTDLIELSRIDQALMEAGFVDHILTPAERAECDSPAHVAARWAAKEAIAKAVGTHLGWHDVEILGDILAAPEARVIRGADPGVRVHLAITVGDGMAFAMAIAER